MFSLPSPLHPLFVHLPIALTLLLPLFAVGAFWAIRRGARPDRTWAIAVGMMAMLTLSSWAALQTGQSEEETVEPVVSEVALETHEEAAEAFLIASGVVLLIGAAGLLRGRVGSTSRAVATVATLGLVFGGWQVGHSGGALVYKEGAASAYTGTSQGRTTAEAGALRRTSEREENEK